MKRKNTKKAEVLGEGDAIKYHRDGMLIQGNCLSNSHIPCLSTRECFGCNHFRPRET